MKGRKKSCALVVLLMTAFLQPAQAGLSDKFKVYFNQPVNTSVSSGTPAIYVNGTIMDTLVSYINNAKYTIDVAQYDYNQDEYFANIAAAVDSAYARGVRVRWIYDGSSPNTGLSGLNSGIYKVASPTSNNYGIMHNKFVIIDANAPDSTQAWLHTSSMDWSGTMVDYDYNNILFIQSQQLAKAYTAEFNMMWGDTGAVPNATTAKFGPYKTDLGLHNFTIDGIAVQLYFSPSDGTNTQILNCIATADSELCFGIYEMTESNDANAIISKYHAGVTTYGILDQYSATSSGGQYSTLSAALGTNLKEYVGNNTIYHNKFMFVDACSPTSDPQVLTGSHNWTKSADEYNDENTLIIHDATITNLYYQSFYQNFLSLDGTMSACTNSTGIDNTVENSFAIYPNPAVNKAIVRLAQIFTGTVIEVKNILGQKLQTIPAINLETSLDISAIPNGVYLIELNENGHISTQLLMIAR